MFSEVLPEVRSILFITEKTAWRQSGWRMGTGQPFPDRTRAAPRSPQTSGESSRLSVARGGPKGHDGIAARRAAHSGVQVPHPAAANDEEAA